MSIEAITNTLYDQVISRLDQSEKTHETPLFVIIGGVPGAGKTTITNALKTKLTKHFENTSTLEIENSFIEDIEEENRIVHDLTDKYCTEPQTNLTDLTYESHVVNYKTYKTSINDKCLSIKSIGGYDTSIEIETGLTSEDNASICNVPMDGFHVPMATLMKYKDAADFVSKRGSYTTFDSKNYIEFIRILCKILKETENYAKVDKKIGFKLRYPGFDHAVGDPRANTYELSIQSKGLINPKVIIFEGLYNLFNEVNFGQDITELLNKYDIPHISYFIDGSDEVLEKRVSVRHLESGIVKTLDEGVSRFKNNDLKNGILVRANLIKDKDLIVINNDS